MTMNLNCSFCLNKGIKGPHNHAIRDFAAKGSPILCPELLNINCTYCKGKGHTVNYCGVLKEKKQNRERENEAYNGNNNGNNNSTSFNSTSFNSTSFKRVLQNNNKGIGSGKRCISIDNNGSVTYKNYDRPIDTEAHCIKKIQKLNVLASMFAALEVEMDKIDADKTDDDVDVSWVNIVSHAPAFVTTKKRWSDYEDDDE